MKGSRCVIYAAFLTALISIVLPSCKEPVEKQSGLIKGPVPFKEIPGITQDEIRAIEELQENHRSFVYGMNPSTEAFMGGVDEVQGYAEIVEFGSTEAALCSVIDKTLRFIDTTMISDQWMRRTFDYRVKLAEAQLPWLIGVSVLFLLVLLLVSLLLLKSHSTGRRLEYLVRRRTGELALQSSKLQSIIDSIPEFMFCKDIHFRYTQCNKYFEQFMGVREADILGKTDKDGGWLTPEDAETISKIEQTVMNEGRILTFEEKVRSPFSGEDGVFETVKAPLKQEGAVIGIIAIIRDITQRKAMEEGAWAASKAKSVFLANMSHELRTPLNVVIGLTDLVLEEETLSGSVTENLVKISDAGNTLLSIVNDILDFSKIESGKFELTPVEYYTSSLLNDIITLVHTRIAEKPVTFSLVISENLPNKLYGDDLRIKQILNNLLSNAIKYTQRGIIELSVQCKRDDAGYLMEIAVKDSGMGIREEQLKMLFTDYYQADVKANRQIEGTGLGLSITKQLAEMMDGEIFAESEYGKGSTFYVKIRQGFVDDTPIGPNIAENLRSYRYAEDKRIVTKKLVRSNLSYVRVLVVDDMPTNLDVTAGLLHRYKMQVDCVTSGQEAIDRINNGAPVYNAIFMDHMMPGMDGIEAADTIRALGTEYARKIPIIALTANAIQGTENIFYLHDFQAFISKPIDIIEMDSVIRKWLRDESKENSTYGDTTELDTSSIDENVVIEIAGVDTAKGLSLLGNDLNLYLPFLRSFAAKTPQVMERLRNVTEETLPDYYIAVHGLKGTSASIGAESVRKKAAALEALANNKDLSGVLLENGKLIKDTEDTAANIKEWLEKYDAVNEKPIQDAPSRAVLLNLLESCRKYDMKGIDKAMSELERTGYKRGSDLIAWIKEKIIVSEIDEVASRLAEYEGEGESPLYFLAP
jgi:PAS domain S-box-containing protein